MPKPTNIAPKTLDNNTTLGGGILCRTLCTIHAKGMKNSKKPRAINKILVNASSFVSKLFKYEPDNEIQSAIRIGLVNEIINPVRKDSFVNCMSL
jgi:hypothetical protein